MITKKSFLGIPLARRSTRRGLVAGYWSTVGLQMVGLWFAPHVRPIWVRIVNGVLFLFLFWIFRQLSGGTVRSLENGAVREGFLAGFGRGFTGARPEDRPLDEREAGLRDRAHFGAFNILRGLLVALLLLEGFMPDQPAQLVASSRGDLFFWLVVISYSLPQTLILWTEPDMEEVQ
jgi:hypothetical protein